MTQHPHETPPDASPNAVPEGSAPLGQTLQRMRASLRTTTDPSLNQLQQEFDAIFECLPEAGARIVQRYKNACAQNGLQPGIVRLYLFGGRVSGKELTKESDIDLAFCIEHPLQSPERLHHERFTDIRQAQEFQTTMMETVLREINVVCQELAIANHFHVLSHGTGMDQKPSHDCVLLAEQ